MIDELNKLMGEKVMGWPWRDVDHKNQEPSGYYDDGTWRIGTGQWNPIKDMNQAMMCVKKYFDGDAFKLDVLIAHMVGGDRIDGLTKWGLARESFLSVLDPQLICQCIAKALDDE